MREVTLVMQMVVIAYKLWPHNAWVTIKATHLGHPKVQEYAKKKIIIICLYHSYAFLFLPHLASRLFPSISFGRKIRELLKMIQ